MAGNVTLDQAVTLAQRTQAGGEKLGESYDQFLVLLTTQLQNQDPLEPMKTEAFTQQLVQYSQIEQQISMNEKLDAMVQLQLAGASNIGLGYVGLEASYIGSDFHFDGERPVDTTYTFDDIASVSSISILDEQGNSVYTQAGEAGQGPHQFKWDGKNAGGELVPEGTYSVSIGANNAAGENLKTTTVVSGIVDGIESQNGVIFLLVGDRAVSLSSVINAREPAKAAAADPVDNTEEQTETTTEDNTSTDQSAG